MTDAMAEEIVFGPFRLDRRNARFMRDGQSIALTPKAFDVLAYLAGRANQLVTKKELLAAIWPDVVVSDASVKVCILEIRKALGEKSATAKYIQTVHRRGYRFIGQTNAPAAHIQVHEELEQLPALVGRKQELHKLNGALSRAFRGERQCILV